MANLNKPLNFFEKNGFYKSDITYGDLKLNFMDLERQLLEIDSDYQKGSCIDISADKASSILNSLLHDSNLRKNDILYDDKVQFMAYVTYYKNRSKKNLKRLTSLINDGCAFILEELPGSEHMASRVESISSSTAYQEYIPPLYDLTEFRDFMKHIASDEIKDDDALLRPLSDFLYIQSSPMTHESAPSIASCAAMRMAYFLSKAQISPFIFKNLLPLLDTQANSMSYAQDRRHGAKQKHFYNIKKLFTFLASLKQCQYSEEILPFVGMSAQSCMYIAQACFSGDFLPKDPHAGRMWLRMSALQGHPLAYYYDVIVNNSMDYNLSGSNTNFIDELFFAYNLCINQSYATVSFEEQIELEDGTVIEVEEYLLYNALTALAKRCHLQFITERAVSEDLNVYDYGIFVIEGFKKMMLERKRRFAAPLFILCSLTYEDLPILDQGFIMALLEAVHTVDEDDEEISVFDKILSILHKALQVAVIEGDIFSCRVLVDQNEAIAQKFAATYEKSIYIRALQLLVENFDAGAVNTLLRLCNDSEELKVKCADTLNFIHDHIHDDLQSPIVDVFHINDGAGFDFAPHHIYLLTQLQNMYYVMAKKVTKDDIASTLLRLGSDCMDKRCQDELERLKAQGRYKPVAYIRVLDDIVKDADKDAMCANFMAKVYSEGNLLPRNMALACHYHYLSYKLGSDESLGVLRNLSYSSHSDFQRYALSHSQMLCDVIALRWRFVGAELNIDCSVLAGHIKKLIRAIYKKDGPFERYLHTIYSQDSDNLLTATVDFLFENNALTKRDISLLSALAEKVSLSFIPMNYAVCQSLFCFNDFSSFEIESYLNSKSGYALKENDIHLYMTYMSSFFVLGFSAMFLDYNLDDSAPAPEILKGNLELLHLIAKNRHEFRLNYSSFFYFMLYRIALRSHVIAPDAALANKFLQLAGNRQSNLSILYEDQDLRVFSSKLNVKAFCACLEGENCAGKSKEVYISKVAQ